MYSEKSLTPMGVESMFNISVESLMGVSNTHVALCGISSELSSNPRAMLHNCSVDGVAIMEEESLSIMFLQTGKIVTAA